MRVPRCAALPLLALLFVVPVFVVPGFAQSTEAHQTHRAIPPRSHPPTQPRGGELTRSLALQAFNSCQAELAKSRPKPAGQKEFGPCGGVIPSTSEGAHDAMSPEHH